MRKNNFFWIIYSDVMTNLFIVFLVLFGFYFVWQARTKKSEEKLIEENNIVLHRLDSLQIACEELRLENEQLLSENMKLQFYFHRDSVFSLLEHYGFVYLEDCDKFLFKYAVKNNLLDSSGQIRKMGKQLERFAKAQSRRYPNLSYLLIIEGNVADDKDYLMWRGNKSAYKESYSIAHRVYHNWVQGDIDLADYGLQVVIAGSAYTDYCSDDEMRSRDRVFFRLVPIVRR